MPSMVCFQAPDFTAPALLPNQSSVHDFCLSEYADQSSLLLFFYPHNFTKLASNALEQLNKKIQPLAKMHVKVVAVSTDSIHSHQMFQKLARENGEIEKFNSPLVSDFNHSIAQSYGVLHPQYCTAQCSFFLIDSNFMIRYQSIYDDKLEEKIAKIINSLTNFKLS